MDCSTPRFPVYQQLLELAQTHVHRVSEAIKPSHSLLSPSPPAFSISQHQVSFNESAHRIRWPNYWSFSCIISPSNEYSGLISFRINWWSPCCPRDSHESSPTPQLKGINSLVLSLLYGLTLTFIHDYWKDHIFDYTNICWQSTVSAF